MRVYVNMCVRDSSPRLLPEGLAAAQGILLLAAGAGHWSHQALARGPPAGRDAGLSGSPARAEADAASPGPDGIAAPWAGDGSSGSRHLAGAGSSERPGSSTGTGHGHPDPPRSWGAAGAQLGTGGKLGCPPPLWPPGPAAQPTASCAGAHCSAVGQDSFVRAQ